MNLHQVMRQVSVAALAFSALTATAAPIVFNFTNEFSGSGGSCANVTCATLSVEQNAAGGVDFTFTANLAAGEYIQGLYGNIDPYGVPLFGGGAISGGSTATLSMSQNLYQADGDGFFDWRWGFETSPVAALFDNSDVLTWTWASTNIDDIINATSVNGPTGKNGFAFAINVQTLDATSPSWFSDDRSGGTVPEPGTLALLGLGVAGLLARSRRSPFKL